MTAGYNGGLVRSSVSKIGTLAFNSSQGSYHHQNSIQKRYIEEEAMNTRESIGNLPVRYARMLVRRTYLSRLSDTIARHLPGETAPKKKQATIPCVS